MTTIRALLGWLPPPGLVPPVEGKGKGHDTPGEGKGQGNDTPLEGKGLDTPVEGTSNGKVEKGKGKREMAAPYDYDPAAYMTGRERLDFFILFLLFGALVARWALFV